MHSLPIHIGRLLRETVSIGIVAMILIGAFYGARRLPVKSSELSAEERRHIQKASASLSGRAPLQAGRRLQLPSLVHSSTPKVVVTLSQGCKFCSESRQFYLRLARTVSADALIVALPFADAAYVRSLGLSSASVVPWDKLGLRPTATPTVAVVGNSGLVIKTWLGLLNQDQEYDVLTTYRNPDSAKYPKRFLDTGDAILFSTDLGALAKRQQVSILMLGERSGFSETHYDLKAVNIPFEELPSRAGAEPLLRSALQAVDCTDLPESMCSSAVKILLDHGIKAVAFERGPADIAAAANAQ